MQIPEHFEPTVFAAALDRMSGALRKEAQLSAPSPEAHALNIFATELYKLAVAMDGLQYRRFRTSPQVTLRPTDGST